MSRILLAPMEGLADPLMRDVLTAIGGYDWGISEFIRVTESVLPNRTFLRTCPELLNDSRTASGTPMRVQLLGSDPHFMAANARRALRHRPAGIDINFGCPAPTVFRHRGGSALLGEPQLLYDIVSAVRAVVPVDIPFTAKMRLGIEDDSLAVDCARAIEAGGADELIVHAGPRSTAIVRRRAGRKSTACAWRLTFPSSPMARCGLSRISAVASLSRAAPTS